VGHGADLPTAASTLVHSLGIDHVPHSIAQTTGAGESLRHRYTSRARMDSRSQPGAYDTEYMLTQRGHKHKQKDMAWNTTGYLLEPVSNMPIIDRTDGNLLISRTTQCNAGPCPGITRIVGQNHANDARVSPVMQEIGPQVLDQGTYSIPILAVKTDRNTIPSAVATR
jgi:hypothetical protein